MKAVVISLLNKDCHILKKSTFILFVLLVSCISSSGLAQDKESKDKSLINIYEKLDKEYGLDDLLVNGEIYTDKYYFATGHAFHINDKFHLGSVRIAGKIFNNIFIKYDICNQQVLARIKDSSGQEIILVLQREFVEEFNIDGKVYKPERIDNIHPGFFQVIGDKNIRIAIRWSKDFIIPIGTTNTEYSYLDSEKESYLIVDSKSVLLRKKKNIWTLLPDKKSEIKKFFKNEKVSVRDMSEYQMYNLVDVLL